MECKYEFNRQQIRALFSSITSAHDRTRVQPQPNTLLLVRPCKSQCHATRIRGRVVQTQKLWVNGEPFNPAVFRWILTHIRQTPLAPSFFTTLPVLPHSASCIINILELCNPEGSPTHQMSKQPRRWNINPRLTRRYSSVYGVFSLQTHLSTSTWANGRNISSLYLWLHG